MAYTSRTALKIVRTARRGTLTAVIFLAGIPALPQNSQDKVMAVKEAMATNKEKLGHYTWRETQTIAINGDVKDTKTFQVQPGPNGPQKTLLSDQKAQSGGRDGRLRQRIVERKTEEYKEYAQKIGTLARQYTTPDPGRLMQAKEQGNVSVDIGQGTATLVIKSFVKPNDQVTLTIDDRTKQPISAQIQSYLDDPSDPVTISAQFAQLPDGTNHVATTVINGESKHLTVNQQNSNYQRM